MAKSHSSCTETGREAVSKWSDVIKSSKQIQASEPRETYLLNTDREDLSEDGLIRRWRFGRKDPETGNRTIILLGETGTGKSTLINMMINYMLGVKWEDKVRFQIITDEGGRSKTESQTSVITAYEIHGLESLSVPFSLTVIDTPGFGVTDGPEKDKIIAQNLYMLFSSSSSFKQIDAVCLVMKASQNRLSPSQKYIFDTILSLFGKNLEKNIMILMTFSDWTPPAALNVVYESGAPFSKDVNNEPVHFLFNNLPPQNFAWKYKEEFQTGWNKGTKSFRRFFKTLNKMEPQSVEMTVKVSGERLSPPAVKLPGNSAMTQSHTSCSETGREAVSKWSDVSKSSEQITSEPRETYLMNTDREDLSEDGLIRRWRFGRKDPETRNRTIILLGETGTGKSTLINMMINYMLGVKWEDKVRFQIITDEGDKPQTEPQTSVITAYEIHGLESLSVPFSLTVIDTPGFGDTDGPEKDKITVQNLYKLFNSSSIFKQIDAVCLVMKASQYRLSPHQKYIFDTILSLFGKNLEKNIMILMTFSDWTPPAALNVVYESGVPFSKNENDELVYFLFNNFLLQKFRKQHEEMFRKNWDAGTESFSMFFQALGQMKPQSLTMTINTLQERQSLDTCVQSLESHMKDVQTKRKALQCEHKTLEELKENMRKHKKSQGEDPYAGWKKINTDGAAIFCNRCKRLCPCPSKWTSLWSGPEKCTFCPGKCKFKHHDFNKDVYIPQDKTDTETDVDDEKETEHKIVTIIEQISKLEHEFKTAEDEMAKLQDRCFECIQQLRENALKFDSDATRQSVGRLIEILQKNRDIQKVKALQQILPTVV